MAEGGLVGEAVNDGLAVALALGVAEGVAETFPIGHGEAVSLGQGLVGITPVPVGGSIMDGLLGGSAHAVAETTRLSTKPVVSLRHVRHRVLLIVTTRGRSRPGR